MTVLLEQAGTSTPGLGPGAAVNSAVYLLGLQVLLQGLTPAGVVHSWVLGTVVYAAFGWRGYLLVCLYFVLGNLVTKIKLAEKQAAGIAEAKAGRRGPWNVWGSGLAAAACALAALATGADLPWRLAFASSICSKLGDTVSSEVGKAYGQTPYMPTTWRKVPPGTEGAVSLEGTGAGLLAALLFSLLALVLDQVTLPGTLVCISASIIANFAESVLGALTQGDVEWLSNNVVNMLQICFAAGLAILGYKFFMQ